MNGHPTMISIKAPVKLSRVGNLANSLNYTTSEDGGLGGLRSTVTPGAY